MPYGVNDWVIDKFTGKIGLVLKKEWCQSLVLFNDYLGYKYPDQLELAPLDIRVEDLEAMIDLALQTNDKQWFSELTERIKEERVLEWQ